MHSTTPRTLLAALLALPLIAPATASPVATIATKETAASEGGCTAASFGAFAWGVRGFDFHASYIFTTPAHQNSWGYASFNLSNPADGSVAACAAASSQLSDFFYGNLAYACTYPAGSDSGGSASFDFDRATGALRVNQSWTCRDEDPQYPTTFTGYGAVNLKLDCTDTQYTNPNWTIGQIYSDREIKCSPVDVDVTPYELTAVA
ncbi:hypothetical protein B0T24DRAFT_416640 [Lasiosphaeria ovina]|uniref:AA1-like domain-containing protein n=1 Tax=Lasiosphaeria ovina TaxID=92902 RepID=A0AAE0JXQ5_9PEZI|nr:hypothetical protein B0T24DRAFT_416640 [Lasiosphaeria ovina]